MRNFWAARREDGRTLAKTYATILFSGNTWVGALLIAATLVHPSIGLVGVAGTLIAMIAARMTGLDRTAIADGRLLFNSTLSSLALAYWMPVYSVPPATFLILLPIVSIMALVVTVALNQIGLVLCGAAARSIPFCVVAALVHWFVAQQGMNYSGLRIGLVHEPLLPTILDHWFRSIGSILFSSNTGAGLLISGALLLSSRISFLHGWLGFGIVSLTLWVFGYPMGDASWVHLNGILVAIAVGGVSFVPSRASTGLAIFSAALCTFLALALSYWLRVLDVPMLTLPFNLTLIAMLAALRWREPGRPPIATIFPGRTPEETFLLDSMAQARFPNAPSPSIAPPFDGEWVVTQGFDGDETHRGDWRHAMDFEVADSAGKPARPESDKVEDFPSFEAPVIAPEDGRVVRVEDSIADNPIGQTNLAENWGNSVVIEIAPSLYVQLSHFRRKGIKVREGDRVKQGQLLGYLGNSGRSPLPHLHVQVQVSPEIGAPTIPFDLRQYRHRDETGWKYHFQGLPGRDETICGTRPARWMQDGLAMTEEKTVVYQIFSDEGESVETIRYSLDASGVLCLASLETKSLLRLVVTPVQLRPVSFEGSQKSLLSLLWLVGRVPLVAISGLEWKEALDPVARVSQAEAALYLLGAPYLGLQPDFIRGRMATVDAKKEYFVVRWSLTQGSTIELAFGENGLERGRCEMAHRWMRFFTIEEAMPRKKTPSSIQEPTARDSREISVAVAENSDGRRAPNSRQ